MQMARIKRRGKVFLGVAVAAVAIFMIVSFLPAVSAEEEESAIEVMSSEAVILDTTHSGTIEKARIVTFFGLQGEGSTDVVKEKSLEGDSDWQGVRGFTTPTVEGDELIWKGLEVDGNANYLSSTMLTESMVDEVRMQVPLKVDYIYEWNGAVISDPNEVTGQDGHFKLSLRLTNTSKEMSTVQYEDPATGQMVTEEVETYLPLVILPYDWYFDNQTFFNLQADPTGVVVPLPEYYQVGWSIPLFPPATEADNLIWVEADVKNFAMPPLTLSANFIFPQTNQIDTLPQFVAGLEMLFDGVKQLNEGLTAGVAGLGDPATEDTLLYGTDQILGGLQQMAAGLPEAQAALDEQLIPGVNEMVSGISGQLIPGLDQAVAGIGDPGTPDTLSYAIDATSVGLMSMLGGIGAPDVANTALFALNAMSMGLDQMATGIGDPGTPNTLLYGVDQATMGLEDMRAGIGGSAMENTLLYAMSQMGAGLRDMKAGIGSSSSADTLLYAMAAMGAGLEDASAGIGSAATPNTLLYAIAAMADGMEDMLAGIGSASTPDTLLYGIDQVSKGISSGSSSEPGVLEGIQQMQDGMAEMYAATSTSGQIFQATNLIRLLAPWTGPICDQLEQGIVLSTDPNNPSMHYGLGLLLDGAEQLVAGIGSPTTPDTLLYGTSQIQGGLQQMKEGIGGASMENTLLYAVAQVQGGLQQLKDGIGAANITNSLLFAVDQVQGGLNQILGGIGTPASPDTLLYAVAQVESGLKLMKVGIGAENAEDTLLYAMSAMNDGLAEMKAGIGAADTKDSLLYAVAQVGNGLELMKAGIGAEGAPNTLLFAMAQVQNGLHQVKTGLSSGDMNAPGLKEGLVQVNAGLSTGDPNNPGVKEGLIMISAGLGDALNGLGSTSTPDTLLYGADQVNSGVQQVKDGLVQAADGTQQMYDGLAENLASLYLTEAQLEAIRIRGEEFDHILGRTVDAENGLAFIYQTPPTYNYTEGSQTSWIVAIAISAVIILALLLMSLLMRRRPVMG
jgi:putative membrane protein